MSKEFVVRFKCDERDAVSAYRLRLLDSFGIKALVVIGLIGTAAISVIVFSADSIPLSFLGRLVIPAILLLFSTVLPGLLYLFGGQLDFRWHPAWQWKCQWHFSQDRLFTTFDDEDTTGEIEWSFATKVLENDRVYVLVGKSEADYLVVPKQMFETEQQETFFRESVKAVGSPKWRLRQ